MSPKWNRDELHRKVIVLLDLADRHFVQLEPRLGAGFTTDLRNNVEAMCGKQSTATTAKQEKKSWTQIQNQTLRNGSSLVSSLRNSMKTNFPDDAAVLQLFGVGMPMEEKAVSSVIACGNTFLEAAKGSPDNVRSAGILAEDLAELGTVLKTLDGANKAQESKKGGSTQATTDRDAAQMLVEESVEKLRAAARLAFRNQPEVLAAFEREMPTSRTSRKKRSATDPALETPAEPE